jgi:hypothetical protein
MQENSEHHPYHGANNDSERRTAPFPMHTSGAAESPLVWSGYAKNLSAAFTNFQSACISVTLPGRVYLQSSSNPSRILLFFLFVSATYYT